jgi:hypothetical protein
LKDFFRLPTVAEQAVAVTRLRAARGGDQSLEQLLERLGALSPEEVQSLMDARRAARPEGG